MTKVWQVLLATALATQCVMAMASTETEKIAGYIGATERMRYTVESAAAGLRQMRPDVATALGHSLGYMDSNEVNARVAVVFDRYVSVQEAHSILAFMSTSLGKRFGTTLRTALSPQALNEAVSQYPKSDANDPMFSSQAMTHMVAAMNSPEWHQTWKDYGEVLMCRHLQQDKPQAYEKLRMHGRCVIALPPVAPDSQMLR